jgi:acetyl esterase
MLHPHARALIKLIEEKGFPPTHTLTPVEARRIYQERRTFSQPAPPAVAEVRALAATGPLGEIPLRLYKPAAAPGAVPNGPLPVLVYFHGGGWVIGDLETHDVLCRELANGSGCAVVAVDYRMGPEHRFPAAVDDCFAAACWLRANASSLGLDASRMAVGGDSAGGNLAAVIALMARDSAGKANANGNGNGNGVGNGLSIQFQLLIYPATDMRQLTASIQANGKGYMLEKATMDYFQGHYTGKDEKVYLDWRASPLLAESHANLPPAFVLTAGFDPLRDEGIAYAQKLSLAGNVATHISFERQIHGFITMGRVIDEANVAVRLCAAELRVALKP